MFVAAEHHPAPVEGLPDGATSELFTAALQHKGTLSADTTVELQSITAIHHNVVFRV